MSTADDTLRILRRTRQVRDLNGEPLTDEQLQAILEVVRWTGSSQNKQVWRFVVIRDRETLQQLGTDAASGERKPGIGHLVGAGAGIAVIMPADGGNSALYDDGRVAERILVAATALGLSGAIGWVRDHQQEEVRSTLGLPADRAVRTIVSVGYPTEKGAQPKAAPGEARLPLEELVHWERWREG
jgi:nitroreductase